MYNFTIDTTLDLSEYGKRTKNGWKIPLIKKNLIALQSLGLALDVKLPAYHPIYLDHPTWHKLKHYQQEAVYELVNRPVKGTLLYLSPGLGKGICSITANELLKNKCTLIVCSKTLVDMWIEELSKWSKDTDFVDYQVWHKFVNDESTWRYANYCITTIETFSGRFTYKVVNGKRSAVGIERSAKFNHKFDCIIFDESLLLKNRNSARFMAFKQTSANKIFLLSGSPVSRYYDDLWTQMHLLYPEAFSSYWKFTNEYCRVNELPGFAKAVVGNKPNVKLAEEYSDLIFRRVKEEVLPDLPPLIFRDRNLELSPLQRKLHDEVIEESCYTLENSDVINIPYRIAKYTKLQQIVSSTNNLEGVAYESVKHDAVMEMLEAGDIEFPCIIWVHWLNGAKTLYNRIREVKGVSIGLGIGEDKSGIELYKKDKLNILLLGMQVGKHGLTLTNTKSVIYVDRISDADAYLQSLARVERIGLKHSPTVTILRGIQSFDKVIEDNIRNKVTGIANLSNSDLAKMLRGLSQKKVK